MRRYISPLIWVVAFETIAYGIGRITSDNMDWYDQLEKPPLNPPDIAFPIVWTILYVLIALAGWRVWLRRAEIGVAPLIVFALYTLLNWGWSFVFFNGQMLLAGFLWIVALNVMALFFMWLCWARAERFAVVFMVPPLLWTCFAGYLNYMIWMLNTP